MLTIGHRGASGHEFENSLKSFRKAIDLGLKYIELDIQSTLDNKLVVFHDKRLERCTNSSGPIGNKTLAELKNNVILKNGDLILTLEEACKLFMAWDITGLFEIKNDKTAIQAYLEISQLMPHSKFIIGSFFHQQIFELKHNFQEALTCIMFECYPVGLVEYLKKVRVDFAAVGFESANQKLIDEIKLANVKSLVWTIDEGLEMIEARNMNVDGIISNYPDKLLID